MTERERDLRAFAVGAVGYSLIELMYRRRTHWTMALTGGVCFVLMHKLCRRHKKARRLHKCLAGAALITAVEYAVGHVVNRVMRWNVWDYSGRRFNLHGQICPRFTLYWFLLGLPVTRLSEALERRWAKSPQKSAG